MYNDRDDLNDNMDQDTDLDTRGATNEGKGGMRLNDNVAVRADGYEVLSSALPRDLDWLVVSA